MNTENANIKGEFRLVKRRQTPTKLFLIRACNRLGLSRAATAIANTGELVEDSGFIKNGITNAGLAFFAQRGGGLGGPPAAVSHLAVGTSSTAFAASQTTLVSEITTGGLARASATVTNQTTTVTNDTIQLVVTWTSSGSHTVEEIGVFNASSGGTMAARGLTGTKTIAPSETLTGTYRIRFA